MIISVIDATNNSIIKEFFFVRFEVIVHLDLGMAILQNFPHHLLQLHLNVNEKYQLH
jgi:hypothetical protein